MDNQTDSEQFHLHQTQKSKTKETKYAYAPCLSDKVHDCWQVCDNKGRAELRCKTL